MSNPSTTSTLMLDSDDLDQEKQVVPLDKETNHDDEVVEEKRSSKWDSSHFKGAGTIDDPYQVAFTHNDPENPLLWSKKKRWSICMLAASHTFAVGFSSSAFTGGVGQMKEYFKTSDTLITVGVSLFVVGFSTGPLLWGPFGETWGRRPIFIISYGMFVFWNLACSLSTNIVSLLVYRFLAGFWGSSPLANGGGIIADTFGPKERGLALSYFALMPFLGPVAGPIVGGFVGQTVGWRWCFRLMAILSGVMYILCLIWLPETYAPIILRKRAQKLSKRDGKFYVSVVDLGQKRQFFAQKMWISFTRPFVMLATEPICALMAVYAACVYGILYAMFEAFPLVYQVQRGWSPGLGGCAFIGIGVGMFLACIVNVLENRRYGKKLDKFGTALAPEERLKVCLIGAPALPIGLFCFAWSSLPNVHWSASIILSSPFGFGMFLVFVGMQNYLVESYLFYAASSLACNSLLRSLFGAAFPLFTTDMYKFLGVQWATSIFGFLSLIFVPIPFLFLKYGHRIRGQSKFAVRPKMEQ